MVMSKKSMAKACVLAVGASVAALALSAPTPTAAVRLRMDRIKKLMGKASVPAVGSSMAALSLSAPIPAAAVSLRMNQDMDKKGLALPGASDDEMTDVDSGSSSTSPTSTSPTSTSPIPTPRYDEGVDIVDYDFRKALRAAEMPKKEKEEFQKYCDAYERVLRVAKEKKARGEKLTWPREYDAINMEVLYRAKEKRARSEMLTEEELQAISDENLSTHMFGA